MNEVEMTRLLAALERGELSRNRAFGRFQHPGARRVLRSHRRLRSLADELAQPETRVTAHWSTDGSTLCVECAWPRLRYHRQLILSPWEAALLRETPAGQKLVPRTDSPSA